MTILDLKRERFTDPLRLRHAAEERAAVAEALGDLNYFPPGLNGLVAELAAVNADLWDAENAIRTCEAKGCFDAEFVALARRIYARNADRAGLKRDISLMLGSTLVEQKHYGPA